MIPVYMGLTSSLVNRYSNINWVKRDIFRVRDVERLYSDARRRGEELIHLVNMELILVGMEYMRLE